MNKLIAVLFSVYNNDNPIHLRLSLDSMLNQTYNYIMVLIGVDGPINNQLRKTLKEYESNANITIFWFEENRGLTAVLNNLLTESSAFGASFIARMDADDISKLDRFEKQVKFLEDNPTIDVVGGAIEEINYSGESTDKFINYPLTHLECYNFFAYRNPLAHPAVMFRPSFFEKVTSYNAFYKKNQDTELWYRAFKAGCKFANIPDVILSFRVSDDMYKRRGGAKFAKEVLKLRLQINSDLHYGFKANIFGYCYYLIAISPGFLKRVAYKLFR